MKFFQREEFLSRVQYAISAGTPITMIVGSPISYDYARKAGVADVGEIIRSIQQDFSSDPAATSKLKELLAEPASNSYQRAFEYVLSVRGSKYANEVIRRSVLNAYASGGESLPTDDELLDSKWDLAPAVNAIGRLLAAKPDVFGRKVITTNFDPLIEVAVKRHGGSCYSSYFHRDGSPGTTQANGVNVIHLHGFWRGSDTLHTPYQLRQVRPQLKGYLLDLFRKSLVVVIAYGGWDDVVSSAIEDVVAEDASDPELLWAFKNTELTHLELSEPRLVGRLRPGFDRGRVQLYGGVDCHEALPMLADGVLGDSSAEVLAEAEWLDGTNSIKAPRRVLSDQEKMLATVVGMQTERHVDTTPRTDGFVGREHELATLAAADASVVCISGFGGQGKSILAARYLSSFDDHTLVDWRDCREEGNTAQTALALFLERLSDGQVQAETILSAQQRELVDSIVQYGANRQAVLVLDNVDTYVDLDKQRPTGVIGSLCDRLLDAPTHIKLILTCRPQVTCSGFFEPIIPGGRLGWGWVDVAA